MLILTRKPSQEIYIDGITLRYIKPGQFRLGYDTHFMDVGDCLQIKPGVRMTYLGSGRRGNQVRLGFDAPRSVNIVRDDAIRKERQTAHANTVC